MASNGPAWQVDITGLSQLILSAGSYGLKQLATSGVDVHSIGCMLMIAEYVPASESFRLTLKRARELQRSERLWMYKVVEIGTATNFLADQLLKTKAGENVLALLSATLPVMDEASCTSLLLTLFGVANTSPNNIPGVKELQSIRDNLAPLARKTGFREKVIQQHHWLWRLLRANGPPQNDDMYNAIPVAGDIPKIIRLFHKIVASDDNYVMIYKGIRGAAWVMTYACSILGLNVCALDKDGNSIPIVGNYEDSQVVLDLASKESNCQLYLAGASTDYLITLAEPIPFKRRGWSIDCTTVNFLELQQKGITSSPSFSRLSYFIALETMNAVSRWALSTQQQSAFAGGARGLKPYTLSVLKALQERSLSILSLLGFRPGAYSDFDFVSSNGAETFDAIGHRSDPAPRVQVEIDGNFDPDQIKQRYHPKTINYSHKGQYIVHTELSNVHNEFQQRLQFYLAEPPSFLGIESRSSSPSFTGTETDFKASYLDLHPSLQKDVIARLYVAINFASILAFSDWNTTFGCMSVRSMFPYEESGSSELEDDNFEGPMSKAIELCVDSVTRVDLETRLWTKDWVALDLDGVVVFRQLSRRYSIHDLDGKYLSFVPGQLLYEGIPCTKIRSDRTSIKYRPFGSGPSTGGSNAAPANHLSPGHQATGPLERKKFEDSCTWGYRELCSRLGETIFIRLEITVQPNAYIIVDSSKAASQLPEIMVTDQCNHGFSTEGLQDGLLDSEVCTPSLGLGENVFEGLSFGEQGKKISIFYQHTSRTPLGQWLACHWVSPVPGIQILQRDCCLKCLFGRLEVAVPNLSEYQLCIIAGGDTQDGSFDRRKRSRSQQPASLTPAYLRNGHSPASPTTPHDSNSHIGEVPVTTIIDDLDSFFLADYVTEQLAKTAFHIDLSQSNSSSVIRELRQDQQYLHIQAAFVIEALDDCPEILWELKKDRDYKVLIKDWNELRAWLKGQVAVHSHQGIYAAIQKFEKLYFPGDSTKTRMPWARFEFSRQGNNS